MNSGSSNNNNPKSDNKPRPNLPPKPSTNTPKPIPQPTMDFSRRVISNTKELSSNKKS